MTCAFRKLLKIAAAAAFASAVVCFGPYAGQVYGFGPCGDLDPAVLLQLNLTDEQKAEITAFRADYLKQSTPAINEMLQKRSELKHLWLERVPDRNKIGAAQEEVRMLRNRMKAEQDIYRSKVCNMLTRDQQEALKRMPPQRAHGHRGMRGRPGMHGEPAIMRGSD